MPRQKALSARIINFIEKLTIPTGEFAGQSMVLHDFQRAFVEDVYRTDKRGRLIAKRAVFSVARKNAKSTTMATIALAHMVGPAAEQNGEIILAATSREQAAILFQTVQQMVEADVDLQSLIKIVPHSKRAYVKRSDVPGAGTVLKTISADAGRAHGLNPSLILLDEAAQLKNRELYEALVTSQGARANPLFITLSTQSNDPQHFLSQMIDDGLKHADPSTVVHLHAADDDCDLLDESQWRKANPAIGKFRKLEEIREMAERASRMPAEEHSFRLLYLNQRVSQHASLIKQADWKACAGESNWLPGEEIILAIDLSARQDLTVMVGVSCGETSKVQSFFWKPQDELLDHAKRDRVPYDVWAREGHLELAPGRSIDPRLVARKIMNLSTRYNIRAIVFDRWRMDELERYLEAIGFPLKSDFNISGVPLIPFGQGTASMSPAIDALEQEVLLETLIHSNNPALNFCMMNAQAKMDEAGNRKLDKSATRLRIDGAVALAMALGHKAKMKAAEPMITNPFEDPAYQLL